jgi:aryl-alcohol dehydrogenase
MSNTTTQIRAAVVREKGGPFSIETLILEGPRRDGERQSQGQTTR